MAEALKGIYNRRHPERTDYYRIIESSFDDFERNYPDQFEKEDTNKQIAKLIEALKSKFKTLPRACY